MHEVLVAIDHALDGVSGAVCIAADVNGDATVTIEDLVALVVNAKAGCSAR